MHAPFVTQQSIRLVSFTLFFSFLYKHVWGANLCRLHRLIADRLNQLIIRIPIIHYSHAGRAANDYRFS
jgi:hypothetical protein